MLFGQSQGLRRDYPSVVPDCSSKLETREDIRDVHVLPIPNCPATKHIIRIHLAIS